MSALLLWQRLAEHFTPLDYEHAGMLAPEPIEAPGFFPVCSGTWPTPQAQPHARILFLGQDFGTLDGLMATGERPDSPTWRNLSSLLADAGFSATTCFFSNVIMGARASGGSNVGPAPAFDSEPFLKKCASFLAVQLEVLRPRGIVVMGLQALRVMRLATDGLPSANDFNEWDRCTGMRPLEITVGEWKGLLAVIVHPCHHRLNVRLRSPLGVRQTTEAGNGQQTALLQQLLIKAGKNSRSR